uniref:DUF7515 domain-containing protein n=1 Tax=Ditylenchus dipsaci TaxID=166011 RepID=A0A915EQC7_9BILA
MVEETPPVEVPREDAEPKFDAQFLQSLHSTLVAEGGAGCHVSDLIKNYKIDWSKDLKMEARKRGYTTVLDMLKDMPKEVKVVDDHVSMIKKEETKSTVHLVDNKDVKSFNKKKDPPRPVSNYRDLFSRSKPLIAQPRTGYFTAGGSSKNAGNAPRRMPFQRSVNDLPVNGSNTFGRRSSTAQSNSNSHGFRPNMFGKMQQQRRENLPAHQVHNELDPSKQTRPSGSKVLNDFGDYDDLFNMTMDGENIPPLADQDDEGHYYDDNDRSSEYGVEDEEDIILEGADQECDSGDDEEEEFYYSADEDEAHDWNGDDQPCNEFDKMWEDGKPIPPKLYRMVHLLKEHGPELGVEKLKDEYNRVYKTILTTIELKNVLGVEDPAVRVTKAAFAKCPLASMFKWRNSLNGFISLAAHDNDDKGSVSGSSCFNQRSSPGTPNGMNNRFSRMSMFSLASTRATTPLIVK